LAVVAHVAGLDRPLPLFTSDPDTARHRHLSSRSIRTHRTDIGGWPGVILPLPFRPSLSVLPLSVSDSRVVMSMSLLIAAAALLAALPVASAQSSTFSWQFANLSVRVTRALRDDLSEADGLHLPAVGSEHAAPVRLLEDRPRALELVNDECREGAVDYARVRGWRCTEHPGTWVKQGQPCVAGAACRGCPATHYNARRGWWLWRLSRPDLHGSRCDGFPTFLRILMLTCLSQPAVPRTVCPAHPHQRSALSQTTLPLTSCQLVQRGGLLSRAAPHPTRSALLL
jgi:hypothetical protein